MKNTSMLFMLLFGVLFVQCTAVGADTRDTDEQMAEEFHKAAMGDVIYTEQELKALYYQNKIIISLLEDIKGLLRQSLESDEKPVDKQITE